jgi:hypothetical protein
MSSFRLAKCILLLPGMVVRKAEMESGVLVRWVGCFSDSKAAVTPLPAVLLYSSHVSLRLGGTSQSLARSGNMQARKKVP